jgi:hypothetical protein
MLRVLGKYHMYKGDLDILVVSLSSTMFLNILTSSVMEWLFSMYKALGQSPVPQTKEEIYTDIHI